MSNAHPPLHLIMLVIWKTSQLACELSIVFAAVAIVRA